MKKLVAVIGFAAGLTAAAAFAQMGGGMMGGQGSMMEQQQSTGPQGGSIGATIFRNECAACHPHGGNVIMPSLPVKGSRVLTSFKDFDAFLRAPKLADGSAGSMPAFPTSKISKQQAKELYQFVTTAAWSGTSGGYGMGPGMMGGMGGMGMMDDSDMPMMGNDMGCGMYGMRGGGYGMGMMGAGAFGALDLTADQRTKINKIQDELRKQHWALMGKMMDEQAKLRDLYDEEKPDAKKIGAVSDSMHGLRKQMIESRIDAYNRMREILTKEQREQLDKWRRKGWGMMGPGYSHGPMMGP
jgi:Spy/CpxP family protein refolding chaperone/mono/diheme cytochrome c family protein